MTDASTRSVLEAVEQRQQHAWASGDYAAVAARIVIIAERLALAAALPAGSSSPMPLRPLSFCSTTHGGSVHHSSSWAPTSGAGR